MRQATLTGTRIRERRMDRGMRQADLANAAGISASYLNLIEHNRRRIGGKLLQTIAELLGVEAQTLAEGAEAALVDSMRAAAGRVQSDRAELDRADEFASRFPGWSSVVAEQDRRIASLEAQVATLADRMAHDPALTAALHEIISSVTSIHAASSILVGEEDVDPHWQNRFHLNIDDDARRLAQSSTALVSYLAAMPGGAVQGDAVTAALSPAEEFAAFLQGTGPDFPTLETEGAGEAEIEAILTSAEGLASTAARELARSHLVGHLSLARAMPQPVLHRLLRECGDAVDPAEIARFFGTDPASAMRRIAALPVLPGDRPVGLAICDGAGALIRLQAVAGFNLPRAGGSCPLWPLYRALSAPGIPIREEVVLPGTPGDRFLCFAIAGPREVPRFGEVPAIEATMLVLPWPGGDGQARPVGLGCQICPRKDCHFRREPSLIGN